MCECARVLLRRRRARILCVCLRICSGRTNTRTCAITTSSAYQAAIRVCAWKIHTHTPTCQQNARANKNNATEPIAIQTISARKYYVQRVVCVSVRVYVETLGFAIRVRAECVCTLNASIKSTYFIVQQPIKQSYIHAAITRRHVWTVAIVINQSSQHAI